MLQFKPSATTIAKIVEWGISFDGSAAATPGKIELFESDVAATVTPHAAADITKYDSDALAGGDPTTNLIQVGASATGYTSTAEGTTTISRLFDLQLLPPTGPYVKQFPLGREPVLQVGKFARIRVTFGTAINAYCYLIVSI
jgi:hypothetical protein